jgi:TRAP-type mannitol/chloroaromatic compound transport system permease small subunit
LNELKMDQEGKTLRFINHWLEILTRFLATISAVMVILMALVTTYSVIRRYVFQHADNNAFLAICVITLLFATLAWAEIQRQKKHIVVDYFSHRFSKITGEIITNIISPVFGLIFCVILLWKNVTGAMFSLEIGEVTLTNFVLPVFPLKVIIIIGVSFLCLVLLFQIITFAVLLWNRAARNKQRLT